MAGRWHKQGLIFAPCGDRPWLVSHAALPVADWVGGDTYRVYFSGRNSRNCAQIGCFDVDITAPQTILSVSSSPVVGVGPLGAFDDSGVTSACLVNHEGRKYQYYTGWALGVTVPFYFYIGLAIADGEGKEFTKIGAAPILERNAVDPYLTASPHVLVENGLWRMWYVSCTAWAIENQRPKHYYHIKYAESHDGIVWDRRGIVCIDYASSDEYAIARPVLVKDNDCYKMWFSHRGSAYRIGYAESSDGIHWQRCDQIGGLDASEAGWDAEMTAYGYVFDHKGTRYMLYNGNGYGKTGIGYAVWRP